MLVDLSTKREGCIPDLTSLPTYGDTYGPIRRSTNHVVMALGSDWCVLACTPELCLLGITKMAPKYWLTVDRHARLGALLRGSVRDLWVSIRTQESFELKIL